MTRIEPSAAGLRAQLRLHSGFESEIDLTGIVCGTGFVKSAFSLPLLRRLAQAYDVPVERERIKLKTNCGVPPLDRDDSRLCMMGLNANTVVPNGDTIAGLKYIARRFVGDVRPRRAVAPAQLPLAPRDAARARAAHGQGSAPGPQDGTARLGSRAMCPTPIGRIETRVATLIGPALLATLVSLLTGRPDWIVLIGVFLLMGVALDAGLYSWLLKYQPPWMTGILALGEFGLLYVLANVLRARPHPGRGDRPLLGLLGVGDGDQDRDPADRLAHLHRVGGRVPPDRMVGAALAGLAASARLPGRHRRRPGGARPGGLGRSRAPARAQAQPVRCPLGGLMSVAATLDSGASVGPYRIDSLLGEGGMGHVYRAVGPDGREVALKLVKPELAEDAELRRRFGREARAASQVRDSHVVSVLAAGEHDGQPYLVQEFLCGGSLAQRIEAEGRLDTATAAAVCVDVAAGLGAMHDNGMVHRDVKPGNILLDERGRARIADFGLVKEHQRSVLTQSGQAVGSVQYMAPEQVRGAEVSAATDTYALGCVVYECLTGAPPFADRPGMRAMWAHLRDEPPDPRGACPEMREELAFAVCCALRKDPAERPPTPLGYARLVQVGAGVSSLGTGTG